MDLLPTKSPAELIDDIRAKLLEKPRKSGAAYTLIVGAGFSHGIVPMTEQLLHECIGSYYYLSDGNTELSCEEARDKSRDYWKEFNDFCVRSGDPSVAFDSEGLPSDVSLAYQLLFAYRTANVQFGSPSPHTSKFAAQTLKARPAVKSMSAPKMPAGEKFVRDFLRYVLDPGAYLAGTRDENAGDLTIGPSGLNDAHRFLASLLELQETGKAWQFRPFCRTIFTTNFDTLLQNALQSVNVSYNVTDRPERGFKANDFPERDRTMHLVYTHGSVLRHNAASASDELSGLSRRNAGTISDYLRTKDVLVFGYGGWKDSLMSALEKCPKRNRHLYWCNIYPAEQAGAKLRREVSKLITSYQGRAFYVPLGDEGVGGFMRQLYHAFAPALQPPAISRDQSSSPAPTRNE